MKELPEVLRLEVLYNLNEKEVMIFFICSKEEDVKREYLQKTKEYLLTTQDIDWKKLDKAILFCKLVKSEDVTSQEIIKIVNGFTLDNGASKVQVLKALASNKELFKKLSLDDKKKIVDYVIFPMGMSPQEEENNEPEVERNKKEMAKILGIIIICDPCESSISNPFGVRICGGMGCGFF